MSRLPHAPLALGIAIGVLAFVAPPAQATQLPPVFVRAWGSPGSGPGQFDYPTAIALDRNENVFVTDQQNDRVQKFDSSGNLLRTWGTHGSATGQFNNPWGIAVDQGGNVYVSDLSNSRVQKFDNDGTFLKSWGSSGSTPGHFIGPHGVAIDAQSYVYVVDQGEGDGRVQLFTSEGVFVTAWRTTGGDLSIPAPLYIAVGPDGRIYVRDQSRNNNILVYGSPGHLSFMISDSLFSCYGGLCVDADGVLHAGNCTRVAQFGPSGEFLFGWGGSGDGAFQICRDIEVAPSGAIYVLDSYACKILKFQAASVPTLTQTWGWIKAAWR